MALVGSKTLAAKIGQGPLEHFCTERTPKIVTACPNGATKPLLGQRLPEIRANPFVGTTMYCAAELTHKSLS